MKKFIALLLTVVLTATIAVSGTLAYLTADAGTKTNTFQVGRIGVELEEEVGVETNGGGTGKETETGAAYSGLMPGDKIIKKVTVRNTGSMDAYVRVTVKLNNAGRINTAIDEYYEGLGYTPEQVQAKYDQVFDGWHINYNPRPGAAEVNDARGVIDGAKGLPEHVMKVDFAKTTDYDNDTFMFGINNWFQNSVEQTAAKDGNYSTHPAKDGYYTSQLADMEADSNDYIIMYTYYILLPEGEETTLFNGLNIPAEFNADQLAMFDGLLIDIDADAIQAANIPGDYGTEEQAKAAFRMISGGVTDEWDGTSDSSLFTLADGTFNSEATEFVITTAEQLAGFAKMVDAGNTFEGQTVKLGANLDMYVKGDNGEPICFDPIGSYRKECAFKGTFDGQGNTISNISQNTWALDNGYYYKDLGLGLFGLVEDATVRNLTIDKASISGESAICGAVAACAYGSTTFEDIVVTNSNIADYQYYSGGIVGWASGTHSYINCDVDGSNTIAAQWGDFDNSIGGIIGGCGGSAQLLLKDCDVACRIDAYNDVTSSYHWYAYRRCGMLIGNTGKTVGVDGTTYAAAPQLTAENCTVTYGSWANYNYCEFAGTSWPYVRVQAGISNSAYSNPRYGHPTDANGNEVVDDNHVHNEGEDHFILCAFDQLYGGGQGVYGTAAHEGVTVIYNNR